MANDNENHFLTEPGSAMGQTVPGFSTPRINETAARGRAGLLNIISASTIGILLLRPEWDPIRWVGPFVIFDMVMAASFGLSPLSPTGVMGTLLTRNSKAVWKPTKPKRFAWILGAAMGATCFGFWFFGLPNSWTIAVLSICFALTWLEGNLGFCVGCWMYDRIFGCEPCDEDGVCD
jgi:hypothetical protein